MYYHGEYSAELSLLVLSKEILHFHVDVMVELAKFNFSATKIREEAIKEATKIKIKKNCKNSYK